MQEEMFKNIKKIFGGPITDWRDLTREAKVIYLGKPAKIVSLPKREGFKYRITLTYLSGDTFLYATTEFRRQGDQVFWAGLCPEYPNLFQLFFCEWW